MINKLAYRNMKRSARNYIVYIFTIALAAAMMYAFNSLIFQNELDDCFFGLSMDEEAEPMNLMGAMIILASVFIVLIVSWLIHYMVRFMLEKRSSEFGIYLLLGMRKKKIASLYVRENILLGTAAFLGGISLGVLLRQVLVAVLFAIVQMEYHIKFSFDKYTVMMTILCYGGCYLLALFRCRRRFKKMNIHALMNERRRNEEVKEGHEEAKRLLLPVSIVMILGFWTVLKKITDSAQLGMFLTGLVVTIYMFYMGVSSWIICYIRRKKDGIYKGQNLFLLRQFASKVKTMQFTMGTLTSLFTIAFMGASVAFMFSDYENKLLDKKFPFDVQIYSQDVSDDFSDEKKIIAEHAQVTEFYPYYIYTDQNNQANIWMMTHLSAFGEIYLDKNGQADLEEIENVLKDNYIYCTYDTYMGISDYNHLREMLGYDAVYIEQNEYVLHVKERLKEEVKDIGSGLRIPDASGEHMLSCGGIFTEPFSQDGHNGGDYIIVVADDVLGRMQPYYAELTASLHGSVPMDLQQRLNALQPEQEGDKESADQAVAIQLPGNGCAGSDTVLVFAQDISVRENMIPQAKYMLSSIVIPLLYIGLVFLCVAVTVLSVQQLSDSVKYKYRYDILAKMGLGRVDIRRLIARQLGAYYLCPALVAAAVSGTMILKISKIFVMFTGLATNPWIYFGKSMVLFLGIYFVYFLVTYIEFLHNVE